jgi:TnpA family transposase
LLFFFFSADVQEEKLVTITTEINAKQKCLEMLENARKRSDLIRQRYEERIKNLSERIQNAEDEKQAAVTKLSKFLFNI